MSQFVGLRHPRHGLNPIVAEKAAAVFTPITGRLREPFLVLEPVFFIFDSITCSSDAPVRALGCLSKHIFLVIVPQPSCDKPRCGVSATEL